MIKIRLTSHLNYFILLTALLFLNTISSVNAQTWVWAQNAGGIFNEARGRGFSSDGNGHIYVSGAFSCPSLTFGNYTVNNNGGDDMYLVKFDTAGNALWATSAGDDYAEEAYDCAADSDGNVFVVGYFWSPTVTFGTTTLTNSGSADIFLVKYDGDGNVLWARSATGSDEDDGYGIATDAEGNVYITGIFSSNSITFGNITLNISQSGTNDLFIAKYDADGNILWAENPAGTNRDQGFGITTDINGDLYVSGNFRSSTLDFGSVTLTNNGGDDMFIVKLDPDGNAIWGDNADGSDYDYSFGVATDPQGNVYTAGQFGSFEITFGNYTLDNAGADDIFIAKYNSSGEVQWAHSGGGFSYDYGYGISVDKNSNAVVAGTFNSPVMSFGNTSITNNSTAGNDFYVAKYDSSGNLLFVINDASCEASYGYNCGTDEGGGIYVTGIFGSTSMTLDNITLNTTAGAYDMWVGKYSNANCSNVYYQDADDDGYGNINVSAISCTAPAGYVADSTDCDDTNAGINPGAIEIPGNGIDEDCDGEDGKATGIVSAGEERTSLSIYPNPAVSNFFITLSMNESVNEMATIELQNSTGQIVQRETTEVKNGKLMKEISFDPSIADGFYLVKVMMKNNVITSSLVHQR